MDYEINVSNRIIAEDNLSITYRPAIAGVLGDPLAALFLHQVNYWRVKMGRPFYKFMAPCEHGLYVDGQSWQEELRFTERNLDRAIRLTATKLRKGVKKDDVYGAFTKNGEKKPPKFLVVYWTDIDRLTWWDINFPLWKVLIEGNYAT